MTDMTLTDTQVIAVAAVAVLIVVLVGALALALYRVRKLGAKVHQLRGILEDSDNMYDSQSSRYLRLAESCRETGRLTDAVRHVLQTHFGANTSAGRDKALHILEHGLPDDEDPQWKP